ncbi:MAG: hypothetical protein HWN81_00560 [Candidatus Lokiarchaeota archaeon]|nr:hypothetical protein [Candidatus Lokiarchaeota archaeon]
MIKLEKIYWTDPKYGWSFDFENMQYTLKDRLLFPLPMLEENGKLMGFRGEGIGWGIFTDNVQKVYKQWKDEQFEKAIFGPIYPKRSKP